MVNLNISSSGSPLQVNPFSAPNTFQNGGSPLPSQANPLISAVPTMTLPATPIQQPLPYSSHKR